MFKTKAEKFPVPYSLTGYTKPVFLVMHHLSAPPSFHAERK